MTTQDSHLDKLEANARAEQPAALPEVEETGTDNYAVRVRPDTPALGRASCVTLNSNNQWLPLIPRDPNRRNAFVLAVDNDVYICSSREVAAQVADTTTSDLAFYLPKQVVILLDSQAPYWVACTTTGSTSRVSILVNQDD